MRIVRMDSFLGLPAVNNSPPGGGGGEPVLVADADDDHVGGGGEEGEEVVVVGEAAAGGEGNDVGQGQGAAGGVGGGEEQQELDDDDDVQTLGSESDSDSSSQWSTTESTTEDEEENVIQLNSKGQISLAFLEIPELDDEIKVSIMGLELDPANNGSITAAKRLKANEPDYYDEPCFQGICGLIFEKEKYFQRRDISSRIDFTFPEYVISHVLYSLRFIRDYIAAHATEEELSVPPEEVDSSDMEGSTSTEEPEPDDDEDYESLTNGEGGGGGGAGSEGGGDGVVAAGAGAEGGATTAARRRRRRRRHTKVSLHLKPLQVPLERLFLNYWNNWRDFEFIANKKCYSQQKLFQLIEGLIVLSTEETYFEISKCIISKYLLTLEPKTANHLAKLCFLYGLPPSSAANILLQPVDSFLAKDSPWEPLITSNICFSLVKTKNELFWTNWANYVMSGCRKLEHWEWFIKCYGNLCNNLGDHSPHGIAGKVLVPVTFCLIALGKECLLQDIYSSPSMVPHLQFEQISIFQEVLKLLEHPQAHVQCCGAIAALVLRELMETATCKLTNVKPIPRFDFSSLAHHDEYKAFIKFFYEEEDEEEEDLVEVVAARLEGGVDDVEGEEDMDSNAATDNTENDGGGFSESELSEIPSCDDGDDGGGGEYYGGGDDDGSSNSNGLESCAHAHRGGAFMDCRLFRNMDVGFIKRLKCWELSTYTDILNVFVETPRGLGDAELYLLRNKALLRVPVLVAARYQLDGKVAGKLTKILTEFDSPADMHLPLMLALYRLSLVQPQDTTQTLSEMIFDPHHYTVGERFNYIKYYFQLTQLLSGRKCLECLTPIPNEQLQADWDELDYVFTKYFLKERTHFKKCIGCRRKVELGTQARARGVQSSGAENAVVAGGEAQAGPSTSKQSQQQQGGTGAGAGPGPSSSSSSTPAAAAVAGPSTSSSSATVIASVTDLTTNKTRIFATPSSSLIKQDDILVDIFSNQFAPCLWEPVYAHLATCPQITRRNVKGYGVTYLCNVTQLLFEIINGTSPSSRFIFTIAPQVTELVLAFLQFENMELKVVILQLLIVFLSHTEGNAAALNRLKSQVDIFDYLSTHSLKEQDLEVRRLMQNIVLFCLSSSQFGEASASASSSASPSTSSDYTTVIKKMKQMGL